MMIKVALFVAFEANLFGVQVDCDDEPVESQHLCEDEDEDHADEEPGLLRRAPHARVAHDPDGVPRGQPGQTHRQTGAHVHEAPGRKQRQNKLLHSLIILGACRSLSTH